MSSQGFQGFNANVPALCVMCGSEDARFCNGCKSVRYCSTACQKNDWYLHKLLCKEMQVFKATRPSLKHILAILLPEQSLEPQLVWFKIEASNKAGEGPREHPDMTPLLGGETSEMNMIELKSRAGQDRKAGFVTSIWFRPGQMDNDFDNGYVSNKCIMQLNGGNREHDHRGSFLITSFYSWRFFEDACLFEFREALDFFRIGRAFLKESEPLAGIQARGGAKIVKGVVVTCPNDQKEFGWKQFMAIPVFSTDPIFGPPSKADRLHEPSIPSSLGIPLGTRGLYPTTAYWKYKDNRQNYHNHPAMALHTTWDLGTTQERVEEILNRQDTTTGNGSLLVVRKDGKDLTPRQLEAVWFFMCLRMGHEVVPASFGFAVSMDKDLRNPKAFAAYFEKYKGQKIPEDGAWKYELCPI